MLFSRGPLRARSEGAAIDTLRVLWPTTATPPTFAIPIDVIEDDEGYLLVFDLAGHAPSEVQVRLQGNVVVVEGAGGRRGFWVNSELAADRLDTEFGDAELRVRVMKARVVAARKIVLRRGP